MPCSPHLIKAIMPDQLRDACGGHKQPSSLRARCEMAPHPLRSKCRAVDPEPGHVILADLGGTEVGGAIDPRGTFHSLHRRTWIRMKGDRSLRWSSSGVWAGTIKGHERWASND